MPSDASRGADRGLSAPSVLRRGDRQTLRFFGEFKELAERRDYESEVVSEEHRLTNPVCGDEVSLEVGLEGERIVSFAYRARGCWPVYGCLQWLGDEFLDENMTRALSFSLEDFFGVIEGVPASKRHAFSLTHRALKRAITRALHLQHSPDGPSGKERL